MRHVESFRKAVADLLAELKARGPPADDDHSIGALLLKIVDPNTGDAPAVMSCNVNGSHSLLPGPSLVEKMKPVTARVDTHTDRICCRERPV